MSAEEWIEKRLAEAPPLDAPTARRLSAVLFGGAR